MIQAVFQINPMQILSKDQSIANDANMIALKNFADDESESIYIRCYAMELLGYCHGLKLNDPDQAKEYFSRGLDLANTTSAAERNREIGEEGSSQNNGLYIDALRIQTASDALEHYSTMSPESKEAAYAYGFHSNKVVAFGENNPRGKMDLFLTCLLEAPDKRMDIYLKNHRFTLFRGYVAILLTNLDIVTERDPKVLRKKFVSNDKEPVIFRVDAANCLGFYYFQKDVAHYDRDEAAYNFRLAIELAKLPVRESDKDRWLFNGTSDHVIEYAKNTAIENLREVERNLEDYSFVGEEEPDLSQMARSLSIGGGTCDCCGKTREKLGVPTLDVCKRCMMAYYCSLECQK